MNIKTENRMFWSIKKFEELSLNELYAIINLRETVFVVEQNCAYLDCDGIDKICYHLFAYKQNNIIAYLRIIPPGHKDKDVVSIGRVVVSPDFRKQKIGKDLFNKGKNAVKDIFGEKTKIKISAQYHLIKFYTDLGFSSVGEMYCEDNIPHIEMHGVAY